MKINKVTITGADDNVDINELTMLSVHYPFVEWGILFSKSREGTDRYPTIQWIDNFSDLCLMNNHQVSAHLCGAYMKSLLSDADDVNYFDIDFFGTFNRVQINCNFSKQEVDLIRMINNIYLTNGDHGTEFIFQVNKSNEEFLNNVILKYCKKDYLHFLFDSSGGNGILREWSKPITDVYCGYAGGLTPDNLQEELIKIEEKVGEGTIWIDAESGLRTNDKLDLDKVRKFLDIVKDYNGR